MVVSSYYQMKLLVILVTIKYENQVATIVGVLIAISYKHFLLLHPTWISALQQNFGCLTSVFKLRMIFALH